MYDRLLQGRELRELRAARPFQRIVFCGDGANDLCPALTLGPDDTVLVRKVGCCVSEVSRVWDSDIV